jgi:hypothetical protein
MKRTLKRINPFQLAKILAALYGLLSLLIVPFFVLAAVAGTMAPHASDGAAPSSPALAIGFALGMAIVMPVLYAAMGFIGGLLVGWIYNLLAKWIGGLEFEVE